MTLPATEQTASEARTEILLRRRVTKVSEVIAREIVHDFRGLAPGTRLPPESEMLARYGVGRNSLREALRILETQGLIVIRQGTNGGPLVGKVQARHYADMTSLYCHASGATYRDVMEARLAMEPVVARLAAQRLDPSSAEALRALAAAPPTERVENYLDTERDFHTLLAMLCGNPVLDLVSRSLKIIYTDKVYSVVDAEMRDRIAADHIEIADAIVEGQAEDAEELMCRHMEAFVRDSGEQHPGLLDEVVDWH